MVPVSVVVPCFRCSETVERAVASVLHQSVAVREIILVDDCSDARTAEKLRKLERGVERARVVTMSSNGGPASARNKGWEDARGEYVAFLDADDAWHPKKIEVQYRLMAQRSEFAFCGHAHRWLRNGELLAEAEQRDGFVEVKRAALLLSNQFTTSSIMVRRAVSHRFREGQRHMEDHLLWLSMVCDGLRAARLDAELSYRFLAPFGGSGLSGRLVAMEGAELANYWRLYRNRAIGALGLAALVPWSLAKFGRRLAIAGVRRALR